MTGFHTLTFLIFATSISLLLESGHAIKILCLHGGGGTGSGFRNQVASLRRSFSNIEFVFPDGGFSADSGSSYLWVPDPPGGKGQPTTDPDISAASMATLDNIVQRQGPFFGIMGYSQGSMFVSAYLSHAPVGTFQMALMFAGYNPLTHLGLLDSINSASPFGAIPALVWMGGQDSIIPNEMTNEQAALYTNPTVIRNPGGGHVVPDSQDPTFDEVVQFIRSQIDGNDDDDDDDDDDNDDDEEDEDVCQGLRRRKCRRAKACQFNKKERTCSLKEKDGDEDGGTTKQCFELPTEQFCQQVPNCHWWKDKCYFKAPGGGDEKPSCFGLKKRKCSRTDGCQFDKKKRICHGEKN